MKGKETTQGLLIIAQHTFFKPPKSGLRPLLEQANSRFLDIHKKQSQHALADTKHILIYLNGFLYLLGKNDVGDIILVDKQKSEALGDQYVLYKSLIHQPVALNALLSLLIDKKMSAGNLLTDLGSMASELNDIKTLLTSPTYQALTPKVDIIDLTLDLISKVQKELKILDKPKTKAKDKFTKIIHILEKQVESNIIRLIQNLKVHYLIAIKPIIAHYGKASTKLQISSLNTILTDWIRDHKIVPSLTHIMVVGAKGPRRGMIEVQFFKHFLKEHGLSTRKQQELMTYIETPQHLLSEVDIDELIVELAKTKCNRAIASAMLDDEDAMNKDVLAPYAKDALRSLNHEEDPSICPYKRMQCA